MVCKQVIFARILLQIQNLYLGFVTKDASAQAEDSKLILEADAVSYEKPCSIHVQYSLRDLTFIWTLPCRSPSHQLSTREARCLKALPSAWTRMSPSP